VRRSSERGSRPGWWWGTLLIVLGSGACLVILAGPSPAGTSLCLASGDCVTDEDDGGLLWNLREGLWSGESVAIGHLQGAVEGGSGTWDGGVGTQFVVLVDEEGRADGDWVLDGSGTVRVTGSGMSGIFNQVYTGDGVLMGENPRLIMSGSTQASGTATITQGGETVTVAVSGEPSAFSIELELTSATCFELVGEWLPPLEDMARDAGWSSVDIDGFFYAYYLGDDPDDALLQEIDQLVTDANAWGDALVGAGTYDDGGAQELVERALDIINRLSELEECLYDNPMTGAEPLEFMVQFLATMVSDMAAGLEGHTFGGAALYDMSSLLLRLGAMSPDSRFGATAEAASEGIRQQAQRIMSDNLVAEGEDCSPCMTGDGREVLGGALSGQALGHSYDVGGTTFTPDEIISSLDIVGMALE